MILRDFQCRPILCLLTLGNDLVVGATSRDVQRIVPYSRLACTPSEGNKSNERVVRW